MSREQYGEKFRQIQTWLHSGDCYQVNLAQRFQASYRGDEWQAFCQLNRVNRAPFSAFICPQDGCTQPSPNALSSFARAKFRPARLRVMPPRLADPQQDARQAEKPASSPTSRAENLMIVDLMRNDIGRVAEAGSVRVPELFVVEPFPAVHHLVSTITARLPAHLHASDLLGVRPSPAGRLPARPKCGRCRSSMSSNCSAIAWCGSIGYLSLCGNMDTSITIRTLTAWHGQLYCSRRGGGIVADSEEAAEYQETFDKVNRILQQLES